MGARRNDMAQVFAAKALNCLYSLRLRQTIAAEHEHVGAEGLRIGSRRDNFAGPSTVARCLGGQVRRHTSRQDALGNFEKSDSSALTLRREKGK
jgi:hypothetical protein